MAMTVAATPVTEGPAADVAARRPVDGIGRRYAYKLLGNIIGSGSRVVVQAIVPRTLGPAAYGDYVFLTSFFSTTVGSIGVGTPLALNTKIAQRPDDLALTTFFTYVVGATGLVTAALVAGAFATHLAPTIWPGQLAPLVWTAALWAMLSWTSQIVTGVADAHGATVKTEQVRIVQSVVSAAVVVAIFAIGLLNVWTLFIYQYVVFGALIVAVIRVLRRGGHAVLNRWRLSRREVADYSHEFYTYSHPLLVYTIVSFVATTGERWLLQRFAGATEQAFYGLSYQVGALCFLFTSAFTPVIMREFSVAFQAADREAMARLFRRYIPLLYTIAACLSAFVATEADRIILIFGGPAYQSALVPMIIMAFYPIHQTYGQLSGVLLYATGRTALYRNIGICSAACGIPLAYVLVAPRSLGGLAAGAPGLALKMVLLQMLVVNFQLYFNARLLGLRFKRYLAHQACSVAALVAVALAARAGADLLAGGGAVVGLMVAGLLYAAGTALLSWLVPAVAGLSRDELRGMVRMVASASRRRGGIAQ